MPTKPNPFMNRDQIGVRIDRDLSSEVKILAIRQKKRFNAMIEEALRDLIAKYKRGEK